MTTSGIFSDARVQYTLLFYFILLFRRTKFQQYFTGRNVSNLAARKKIIKYTRTFKNITFRYYLF